MGRSVALTAASLALSLFRRAAWATAYLPDSRLLERNERFTLERIDFAIGEW